jgi:hypothetical protein
MSAKTTSKKRKTTSSSPSEEMKGSTLKVHYPSKEEWANLIQISGFETNNEAKHALWEFIGDMVADVLNFQKVQKAKVDRSDGTRRIKNLDSRILNLKNALNAESKTITEIIPLAALEQLGELFTVGAASTVAKKMCFPKDPLPTLNGKEGEPEIRSLEDVENYYVGMRRDNGLLYGTELLQLSLETIHKPIRDWLTKNSDNLGGRPKKSSRDAMIHRTIVFAEKNLKFTPETKKGGNFLTFCNLCLVSCGVPENGLDKAIAAAINEHAKKAKPTSKTPQKSKS